MASGGGSTALDEKTVRWKEWEVVSTAAASTQGHSTTTSASGSCDGSVRACPEAEVAANASGPPGLGYMATDWGGFRRNPAGGAAGNQEKKGAAEYLERIRQKKYRGFPEEAGDDEDEAIRTVMSGEKARQYKFWCATCKEELPASELYLEALDDWCGGVTASCYICSVYDDPRAFRKAAKHRWTQRARELCGKEQRLRCVCFESLEELFKLKAPGAKCAERRKLMVTLVKAIAIQWYDDIIETEDSEAAAK
ncbi:MAG: hypothetical protein GY772_24460, partial [bacterium]|nr:hypothetical protein [bacterium]